MGLSELSSKPKGKPLQFSRWLLSHQIYLLITSILIGLGVWQLLVVMFKLPAFILPSPIQVWQRFLLSLQGGTLVHHTLVTLWEVLLGLFVGGAAAMLVGYGLARSATLEKLVSPYLVASQAIPMVAIAPLLVIWFGPGIFSKVLICSLIVFFPVLINTVVGIRSAPQALRDLMCSLDANRFQTLIFLEIPAALPVFLGGLRVGATLSVIGAVVGELVGADEGLGFLINVARGQYDTALVFVSVLTLIVMALMLYGLVILAEMRLLRWRKADK